MLKDKWFDDLISLESRQPDIFVKKKGDKF